MLFIYQLLHAYLHQKWITKNWQFVYHCCWLYIREDASDLNYRHIFSHIICGVRDAIQFLQYHWPQCTVPVKNKSTTRIKNTLLCYYRNTKFCKTHFLVSFKISLSSSSFNFLMKLSKTGISNLIYCATCKTMHYCINHWDVSIEYSENSTENVHICINTFILQWMLSLQ